MSKKDGQKMSRIASAVQPVVRTAKRFKRAMGRAYHPVRVWRTRRALRRLRYDVAVNLPIGTDPLNPVRLVLYDMLTAVDRVLMLSETLRDVHGGTAIKEERPDIYFQLKQTLESLNAACDGTKFGIDVATYFDEPIASAIQQQLDEEADEAAEDPGPPPTGTNENDEEEKTPEEKPQAEGEQQQPTPTG